MSANTETAGADRTGCKAWCGKRSLDSAVPAGGGMDGPVTFVRGDMYDSARIAYCSQSCRDARLPAIAAPAAHVERRKGQRWRCDSVGFGTVVGTLIDLRDHHWSVRRDDGSPDVWIESRWKISGFTMTLLADATPEPAECGYPIGSDQSPCNLNNGHLGRHSLNRVVVAPPAQEAPKAAPKQFWFTDDEGEKIGPFATGLEADDASVAYGAWMRTQAGTPYAGPERLPRPQLAADWAWDLLEDA